MSGDSSGFSQPQYHEGTARASEVSQTALCSGANFSIYVMRELIGVGNTSSVYRAHDPRLRREVAVKVLNTGALAGQTGLARFLHEARMAAAVRHPNVVAVFDVGVHDDTPYIVMELLEGENLDERLHAARALREPVLIDVALQLVSGLAAVHDAGVVHRDVRPSNVFLARAASGAVQPKLLDFSVSKQTRDNLRLTTNGRRRWASMPLYTAPEVLLDGEATFRSDQYSLGVLLYECVTGVNPFRADTARESVELITTGGARRITEQPIRPSRRLAAVIEKAMHIYPDQRFGDLRELGDALASLSERGGRWTWLERGAARQRTPASRASSPPPPLETAARSRRELSWALGATVLACSIGAPVWAWWSVHRRPATAPVDIASPWVASDGAAAVTSAGVAPPAASPPGSPSRAGPAPSATLPLQPLPAQPLSAQPLSAQPGLVDAHGAATTLTPVLEPAAPRELDAASAPALASPASSIAAEAATASPLAVPGPLAAGAEPGIGEATGASSAAGDGTARPEGIPGLPPLETPALEGDALGGALAPPTDGGPSEPHEPPVSPSLVAAPPHGPERGTNGALIFD